MHPDQITISFLDGVVMTYKSDEYKNFTMGPGACSIVLNGTTQIYPLSTIKFISLTHQEELMEKPCEGACFLSGQFDKVCVHHPAYVEDYDEPTYTSADMYGHSPYFDDSVTIEALDRDPYRWEL